MKENSRMLSLIVTQISLFVFSCANREIVKETAPYPFQSKILQYANTLPKNGTYGYYWAPGSNDTLHLGTTKNIDYLGVRISDVRENRGTHCVGVSWQVCMTVLQDWANANGANGKIQNLTVDDVKKFADRWFIKLDAQSGVTKIAPPEEKGAAYALTSFNLGEEIPFDEAQPGDFVQFWRKDGSGHSCVFLKWVRDEEGNIIGVSYWGSQPQTNGIGSDTEYFDPYPNSDKPQRLLNRNRFYIGRLAPR